MVLCHSKSCWSLGQICPLGMSAQAVMSQEHHPYAKEIVEGRASNLSDYYHYGIVSCRSRDVWKSLVYRYKYSIQVSSIQKRKATSQKTHLRPRFQTRLFELYYAKSFSFSHAHLMDKIYPMPFGLSVCF